VLDCDGLSEIELRSGPGRTTVIGVDDPGLTASEACTPTEQIALSFDPAGTETTYALACDNVGIDPAAGRIRDAIDWGNPGRWRRRRTVPPSSRPERSLAHPLAPHVEGGLARLR
jgi:hypothetical protein